jgi:hypothetical protein
MVRDVRLSVWCVPFSVSSSHASFFHFLFPTRADVYEVLGLPRPANHSEASRITMAQIRNGYRTQLMKYHPDFHREESTSDDTQMHRIDAYITLLIEIRSLLYSFCCRSFFL